MSVGLALVLVLVACDADTIVDSGTTDTGPGPDTDPLGIYFDTYAVGWDLTSGIQDGVLRPVLLGGSEQPPRVEVTFYEQAYFETLDEASRCTWVGALTSQGDHGLELGEDLWSGWQVSLTLWSEDDNTCTNFSPIRWGEDTPTTVLESAAMGIGFGPATDAFAADVHDGLAEAGWSDADWERYFGPFLYSTYFAGPSDPDGALVGLETNLTRTYQVDEGWSVLTDDEGYLVPIEVSIGQPEGYVSSQTWRLYDARAWY